MVQKNWTNISNMFSPMDPIPPEKLEDWFVKRSNSPIDMLMYKLSPNHLPSKYILVGQPASGKSSELTKLAEELEQTYDCLVVRIDLTDNLDADKANPVEIIFLMGVAIFKVASNKLIGKPPELCPDLSLLEELKNGLESIATSYTENRDFKIDLGKLLDGLVVFGGAALAGPVGTIVGQAIAPTVRQATGGLFGRLQHRFTSGTSIQIVRKLDIEPKVEDLIKSLSKIIDDVYFKLNRPIVVLVDGLDKIRDPDVIKVNFIEKNFLNGPKCHVVYTGPLDLYYSPDFGAVRTRFSIVPFSNIKIHPPGNIDEVYESGYEFMRQVVESRLKSENLKTEDVIDLEALNMLIKGSGGVMRDFIRLVQNAVVYTQISKKDRIGILEAVKALNELRRQLKAQLTPDYQAIVDLVYKDQKRVDGTDGQGEKCDLLLRNDIILGYVNEDIWFDKHSVLTDQPWKALSS